MNVEEIKFGFHRRWAEAGEEAIAKRVATIVSHTPQCRFEKENDNRWNLDSGNNWWLRINLTERTATLKYRYGGGGNMEFMKSLEKVLEWIF